MSINLVDNFNVAVPKHLDARLQVELLVDLLTIPVGVRYLGMFVYVTDEEAFYYLKSGTADINWEEFSGGSGSGSGSLDTVFQDDMEKSVITDYTATDIVGIVIDTAGEIHGSNTLKITHDESPSIPGYVMRNYPLDPKFRGKRLMFSLALKSEVDPGLIKLTIRDITNGVNLVTSADIDYDNDGNVHLYSIPFSTPYFCDELRYSFQILPADTAGQHTWLDDIRLERVTSTDYTITPIVGDQIADGSWRWRLDGVNLVKETLSGGVWQLETEEFPTPP